MSDRTGTANWWRVTFENGNEVPGGRAQFRRMTISGMRAEFQSRANEDGRSYLIYDIYDDLALKITPHTVRPASIEGTVKSAFADVTFEVYLLEDPDDQESARVIGSSLSYSAAVAAASAAYEESGATSKVVVVLHNQVAVSFDPVNVDQGPDIDDYASEWWGWNS